MSTRDRYFLAYNVRAIMNLSGEEYSILYQRFFPNDALPYDSTISREEIVGAIGTFQGEIDVDLIIAPLMRTASGTRAEGQNCHVVLNRLNTSPFYSPALVCKLRRDRTSSSKLITTLIEDNDPSNRFIFDKLPVIDSRMNTSQLDSRLEGLLGRPIVKNKS